MARIPTDREILQAIHDRHHAQFVAFDPTEPNRVAKTLIPIDCAAIAYGLNVDPDTVFGRLYYHLEEKYGYETPNEARVAFFVLQAGTDRYCVNFPLMESVLAGLQEEWAKHLWSFGLSIASIVLSVISLAIALAIAMSRNTPQ